MSVNVEKSAVDLREMADRITGLERQIETLIATGLSVQEETGDTSTTAFAVIKGWKPLIVFSNGSLMREGTSDDYTLSFDGFVWTVTFAVAPAAVDVTFVNRRS